MSPSWNGLRFSRERPVAEDLGKLRLAADRKLPTCAG
jgi:hypothetical protein